MCESCDGTLTWDEFRVAAIGFSDRWNKFSKSYLPKCSWINYNKRHMKFAQGYLSLENVLLRSFIKEDCVEGSEVRKEEESCSGQDDDTVDDASLVQSYGHEIHRFDFHIVYSPSYKVPLLYFRAYHIDFFVVRIPTNSNSQTRCLHLSFLLYDVEKRFLSDLKDPVCKWQYLDGQPLALDDIERYLSADSAKLLMESKWTFITQEEHPYLNRPWYTLHPCGTSEWMKLLIEADSSQARGGLRFEKYLFAWFSVVGQVFGLRIPLQMLSSFDEV